MIHPHTSFHRVQDGIAQQPARAALEELTNAHMLHPRRHSDRPRRDPLELDVFRRERPFLISKQIRYFRKRIRARQNVPEFFLEFFPILRIQFGVQLFRETVRLFLVELF